MLTLAILSDSPATNFVPGIPGVSFPATDELGNARGSPASAGAYEIAPLVIETNGQPPILSLQTNQYVVALGGTVVLQVSATNATDITEFGLKISARTNVIDVTISNTVPGVVYLLEEKTNLTNPSWTVIQTLTASGTSTVASPISAGSNQSLFFEAVLSTNEQASLNNFSYQWLFNGEVLTDNATYSGTTSSHLTIRGVTAAQAGTNYQVVVGVSTLQGVTTSAPVSLNLNVQPKITVQPVSKIDVPYGAEVTFSVGATGAPLSYKWFLNGVALTNANEFSGTTMSNLTINPATLRDESNYTVVVANAQGTITSLVAVLSVVADTTKPGVAFSSPDANARTTNSVITGTASDKAQVVQVKYGITNVNAGHITVTSGTNVLAASGATTKTWTITNALLPGTNYVTVQSVNYSSIASAPLTREFFYVVPAPFALIESGNGTVTGTASVAGDVQPANGALLNIGEGYTLTALPGRNYVLTNWTGSWTGANGATNTFTNSGGTLHFIMESNESITATFTSNLLIGARGTYNGLFYGSNLTVQTAGMLSGLTINTSGVYSGTLLLKGSSLTLAPGSFDSSGYASNHVTRTAAQGGPVTVEMSLGWTNGLIRGSVSGADQGGWTSTLEAEKAAGASPSSAYTVLLGPETNSAEEIPPGYGYMLITNHNGSVTFSGAVADGATFSQTAPLGVSGDVPVYYGKFYGNTGLLLGWLGLSNGTVEVETPMGWIRPAAGSGLYNNGFTNLLTVTGSGWTNPPAGVPATSLSGGTLTITNSSVVLDYDVSITNNTVVKNGSSPTNILSGKIVPTTGLLQITFGNGTGAATTVGYGAWLQDSNSGGGYFVTKTNAGFIQLLPP
jgi:hypothetical protein